MMYPQIKKCYHDRLLRIIYDKAYNDGVIVDEDLSIKQLEDIIPMDFNMFKHYMELAHDYFGYADNLSREFNIECFSYPSAAAADQLAQSMEIIMFDTKNKYISYFMHELNFGAYWSEGQVIYKGKEFELDCLTGLWRLLLTNILHELLEYQNL